MGIFGFKKKSKIKAKSKIPRFIGAREGFEQCNIKKPSSQPSKLKKPFVFQKCYFSKKMTENRKIVRNKMFINSILHIHVKFHKDLNNNKKKHFPIGIYSQISFSSLNKIKQFLFISTICIYISVLIVHFLNFRHLSSKNISITTKSDL